jgi:hypothetical protein
VKKFTAILSIGIFALLLASIDSVAQDPGDGAERITAYELKARMDRGENIVIFDVRARESHGETKIKGSIAMPLIELEGRIGEIPFGAIVAAYCT